MTKENRSAHRIMCRRCNETKQSKQKDRSRNRNQIVSVAVFPWAKQGARKDGRGNEPVGSWAICDARSTGPRALEGKNS